MEELRIGFSPWYLYLKFIHVFAVGLWSFSTAVAYRNYLVPAFRGWLRNPDNVTYIDRRNQAMERFDRGVILEHVAFPVILITGPMMAWIANMPWYEANWLGLKIAIVILIFLPIEIFDYYLSHYGGNKERLRLAEEHQKYEQIMARHWLFLRLSTPLIVVFVPLTYFLAVTKPS